MGNWANFWAGLQGFICNIGCQFTTRSSSCKIDQGGSFVLVGGGYQQFGISEVLAIQPYARPEGPVTDSHNHHNHNFLHGTRNGSLCLPTVLGRKIH